MVWRQLWTGKMSLKRNPLDFEGVDESWHKPRSGQKWKPGMEAGEAAKRDKQAKAANVAKQ